MFILANYQNKYSKEILNALFSRLKYTGIKNMSCQHAYVISAARDKQVNYLLGFGEDL